MSEIHTLRRGLPPLPARIQVLPVDHRGYPVPKFVAWVDGVPDHRIADPTYVVKAIKFELCWICGEKLGRYKTFVTGPMCAVNRISSEPPEHHECAVFSVKACPHLSNPRAQRRAANLPESTGPLGGVMLTHNPTSTLVWTTVEHRVLRDGDGVLFDVGHPEGVEWFHQGERATREQVLASFGIGLPKIREMAERDGPRAIALFERRLAAAMELVPQ